MRPDLIDAIDVVRDELARIEDSDDVSSRIVLAHAMKALRFAKDADGLAPDRRRQVRAAYKMCCRHLGVDHAA